MTTTRSKSRNRAAGQRVDAESMAKRQREISVSEFFAKNRHLLGFDNPRKALMTTIKEAVDNALDACEEGGILPDIFVGIEQLGETRFRVTVRDNGPGIVRAQIENVFGRLLYGSKFHRLKMSRGQQGIGIAAAGMYGLMTTGKPMVIHSKPKKTKPSHRLVLAIDTQKNRAEVSDEEERYDFPHPTGTEVVLEMEARYQRGRQSVDEYLKQTAIACPHAQIIFQAPDVCKPRNNGNGKASDNGEDMPSLIDDYEHAVKLAETATSTVVTPGGTVVFPRTIKTLPPEPKEIKPHPKGIELGTLLKMTKTTPATKLGGFLQDEFCRVSPKICNTLTKSIGKTPNSYVSTLSHQDVEKLYETIQETKFMSPPTDCLAPIGPKNLLAGLLKGEKAEFYTAVTRDPAVYRGNPFQIEVGLAYGGTLAGDEPARVIRFANRVPLLYQQSACCAFKAAIDTTWRNYGLSQPRGGVPVGPLVVMVHMASVWVPFTSESKEAIADYDEIRKEMKLALAECGRKLRIYLGRRARMRREGERRDIFKRYIGEVVKALSSIDTQLKPDDLYEHFREIARQRTAQADMEFDENGNPIKKREGYDVLAADENTVVIDDASTDEGDDEVDDQPIRSKVKTRRDDDEDDDQQELFN